MTLKQIQLYWQSLIGKVPTPRQAAPESSGLRAGQATSPVKPGFYTACMIQRSQWDAR
jgi:hypothetical protein